MNKQQYHEYLQSEEWKQKREKRKCADLYECAICGSQTALNVHHLNYDNVGNEDIETDLITLCHKCHAMLHRIRSKFSIAYMSSNNFDTLINQLVAEIWVRDVANGGDIKVFDTGMRMTGKLLKTLKLVYPQTTMPYTVTSYIGDQVKDRLVTVRTAKIIELYNSGIALSSLAEGLKSNATNIQKVLKRHGFNATAKIK